MSTSSKIVTGGSGRSSQVADLDPEPTLLAYRRPEGDEPASESPADPLDRSPAIILRIPHLQAEIPGAPAAKVDPAAAAALKNKLFWGFGIAGILVIALLMLTGKKPKKENTSPARETSGPRQAPGAPGPIAPLPGGQPLNMQPVPTYKEENPRAVPGAMTPLGEPAALPPEGPSMPAPVAAPVGPEFTAPSDPSGYAPPPSDPQSAPPGPRPSDRYMGQPPQHPMPWRNEVPPPAEQGPQLSPGDPRQGMNQPNRGPFTLPENDPRMGPPSGADQGARYAPGGQYQPGGPAYRTADRSGQSGASFEGTIIKPNSEGQYDRSRSRPY